MPNGGKTLVYDFLVIATGAQIHPEETTGLQEHEWHKSIHDFYTIDGSLREIEPTAPAPRRLCCVIGNLRTSARLRRWNF